MLRYCDTVCPCTAIVTAYRKGTPEYSIGNITHLIVITNTGKAFPYKVLVMSYPGNV